MDIITRQQAVIQGLTKYFTGEPCKNGHLTYRYTHSCTCVDCIRASKVPNEDRSELQAQRVALELQKADQRERRLKLAEAKIRLQEQKVALRPKPKRDGMVEVRVLLHFDDLAHFKAIMHARAMEIDPTITMVELMTNKVPETVGQRSIHTFKCFGVDFDPLHKLENEIARNRVARGDDPEALAHRAEMRRRAEEDARRLDTEDNGRPQDITA